MQLVVDTNIIVGELLRQRGRDLFLHPNLTLYMTDKILEESQHELPRRVAAMVKRGLNPTTGVAILQVALNLITTHIILVESVDYKHWEIEAKKRIPSDLDDWPTIALALELNLSIWTQDSDFLGCGCATWTTETLRLQLS